MTDLYWWAIGPVFPLIVRIQFPPDRIDHVLQAVDMGEISGVVE